MKTYWLHGLLKPIQASFPTTPTLHEPPPSIDPLRAELLDSTDTRSLYSPVTFEDVSRYSPILSPTSSSISDMPGVETLKLEDPLKPSYDVGRSKGNVSDDTNLSWEGGNSLFW